MILLFFLLFALQGSSASEWIDSCNSQFLEYEEQLQEINPDVHFCRAVLDLDLEKDDVEKLGKDLNWFNYLMMTSQEYVDNLEIFQKYGIKDTLLIYPSLGTRDSLPPSMESQISFNYTDGKTTKKFDQRFSIHPFIESHIQPLRDNPTDKNEKDIQLEEWQNIRGKTVKIFPASVEPLLLRGYFEQKTIDRITYSSQWDLEDITYDIEYNGITLDLPGFSDTSLLLLTIPRDVLDSTHIYYKNMTELIVRASEHEPYKEFSFEEMDEYNEISSSETDRTLLLKLEPRYTFIEILGTERKTS